VSLPLEDRAPREAEALTTELHLVPMEIPDGRLRHVLQILARLDAGVLDVRSVTILPDGGGESMSLDPRTLDADELAEVRAELEAAHERALLQPLPDPVCPGCGATPGRLCAASCPHTTPF
jgi:hypothetical protein